jgi:hypothetical protein
MTSTVRDLLNREMEADQIHGITVSHRQGETLYLIVAREATWRDLDGMDDRDIPVLDLRTVVVDFEADSVRVSDNGMWLPKDPETSGSLSRMLTRAEIHQEGEDLGPLLESVVDGIEPELVLEREIEEREQHEQHVDKMRSHTGIDPARDWGYGAGPPPEIETVEARLREAGLDPAEHLTRLVWGKKEPMDRVPRPIEELTGNYGIELQPRDSGLIALDVDYPEEFPDSELPETFEVSSPHGSEEQRHVLLRCDRKEELANELGAWAIQGVDWGDLWIGDRYVVGPGSQLSEYGCDHAEHERGEAGGCDRCEDPDAGYYDVVSDREISTVEPEEVLDLIEESTGYDLRDRDADPEVPEHEHDPEEIEAVPTCDSCGIEIEEEEQRKEIEIGGETRLICRGGCD